MKTIPFSILDVAPIIQGGGVADALQRTVKLAQMAEEHGFTRFWLAEHHNAPNIASSATSVVIAHVAAQTKTIRVGSGGVMLPNHAPLAIAEQFGTLDALYPGRIDLGLGRAPGTDPITAKALRGERHTNGANFPEQLEELQSFMHPAKHVQQAIRAIPGEGADVPIWLLGSSDFSAALAAEKGLPFAFAGHFSPTYIVPALKLYQQSFKPSSQYEKPYSMVAVNVIAAETDEEAQYLATSMYQMFLGFIRNKRAPLQPPVEQMDEIWSEQEKFMVEQQVGSSIIGSKQTVREQLQKLIEATDVDEIMATAYIFDHEARMKSFKLLASILQEQQ